MTDIHQPHIEQMIAHIERCMAEPSARGERPFDSWAQMFHELYGNVAQRALLQYISARVPTTLPSDVDVPGLLLMQLDAESRMSSFNCTAEADSSMRLGNLPPPYMHASGLLQEAIFALFILLYDPVRDDPNFSHVRDQALATLKGVQDLLDEYALTAWLRKVRDAIDVLLHPERHLTLGSSASYLTREDVYHSIHEVCISGALSAESTRQVQSHLEDSLWSNLRFLLPTRAGAELDAQLAIAETILFAAAPTAEHAHELVTKSLMCPSLYTKDMERQTRLWQAAQLTMDLWRSQADSSGMLHEPRAYGMIAGTHNKGFDMAKAHSLSSLACRLADARALDGAGANARPSCSLDMIREALDAGPLQAGEQWEASVLRDALYMRLAETERRPLSTSIAMAFRQVAEMMEFPADDPHALSATQALYCAIYVDDKTQAEIFARYQATKIGIYSKRGAALRIEGALTNAPVVAVFLSPSRISPDEMLDSDINLRLRDRYLHAHNNPVQVANLAALPVEALREIKSMPCTHPHIKWESLPILDLLPQYEDSPRVPMPAEQIEVPDSPIIGITACCEDCGRTRLASIPAWNLPLRDEFSFEGRETLLRSYNLLAGYSRRGELAADIEEVFAREPLINPADIAIKPHLVQQMPAHCESELDWDEQLYL